MASVRIGIFPPVAQLNSGPEQLQATLALAADVGVDHLCVGDHVSFFVGAGSDGLITAASMLAAQAELPVYVGLYLLPLRHPVPVARQLATIAQLAPGRLTLGVGIGGEDPHELEICGVDPRTRGRRMDECLQILRGPGQRQPGHLRGHVLLDSGRADRARAVPGRYRSSSADGRMRRSAAPRGSATAGSGSGSRPAGTPRCAIRSP